MKEDSGPARIVGNLQKKRVDFIKKCLTFSPKPAKIELRTKQKEPEMKTSRLDPYLQKQVELGSSGIDIMHGALKTIMHEFENKTFEDESYQEGYMDCLVDLYGLTYDISFAIMDKEREAI